MSFDCVVAQELVRVMHSAISVWICVCMHECDKCCKAFLFGEDPNKCHITMTVCPGIRPLFALVAPKGSCQNAL